MTDQRKRLRDRFFESETPSKVLKLLLIGFVLLLAFQFFDNQKKQEEVNPFSTSNSSSFQGKVIIARSQDNAKEYRLDANIYVEARANREDEHSWSNNVLIEKVYWPNGGYLTFDNCRVYRFGTGDAIPCEAQDGQTYTVELIEATKD